MSNEPNRFPFTAYFPDLTQQQLQQLDALYALYTDWNAKINVISRKDIENLYPHHVLHSLGIVKMLRFKEGSTVMDLGTGGGFPGIPLAILFPQVHFHLVDSIGKKIKVANLLRRCEGRSLRSLRIVLEERFANRLANRSCEPSFWRQFRFCFAGLSESSGAFSGSFALFLSAF